MKNIVQATLLGLALLVPATGFSMESGVPATAPVAAWSDDDCGVCLGEDPSVDHIQLETPHLCHTYHRACITAWFRHQQTTGVGGATYSCPACRGKITEDQRTALGLAPIAPAAAPAIAALPPREPEMALWFGLVFNNPVAIQAAINTPGFDVNQFITLDIMRLEALPQGRVTHFNFHPNDGLTPRIEIGDSRIEENELNQTNSTFLMAAARRCTPEVINTIVTPATDINHRNDAGKSAVTHAIEAHKLENIDALLAHGATTTAREKLQIIKLRLLQHKGKILAGACALAAAGMAYYLSPE